MPKKPKQFKKSVEKTHPKKSPSNSRNIPESVLHKIQREWKVVGFSFLIGILLTAILFFAYDSFTIIDSLEMEKQRRVVVLEEIAEWERVIIAYPDYRDGYFKLALLYYQIGNRQKARGNISEALRIDPQFENGKILQEKLGK